MVVTRQSHVSYTCYDSQTVTRSTDTTLSATISKAAHLRNSSISILSFKTTTLARSATLSPEHIRRDNDSVFYHRAGLVAHRGTPVLSHLLVKLSLLAVTALYSDRPEILYPRVVSLESRTFLVTNACVHDPLTISPGFQRRDVAFSNHTRRTMTVDTLRLSPPTKTPKSTPYLEQGSLKQRDDNNIGITGLSYSRDPDMLYAVLEPPPLIPHINLARVPSMRVGPSSTPKLPYSCRSAQVGESHRARMSAKERPFRVSYSRSWS